MRTPLLLIVLTGVVALTHPVTAQTSAKTTPKPKAQPIVDSAQDTPIQPASKWPSKANKPSFYDSVRLPAHLVSKEVDNALVHVRWAWADNEPCSNATVCTQPIGRKHFGWDDGTVEIGPVIQRWTASPHDAIQKAEDALKDKHRALAVEWVMASQAHNAAVEDWVRTHPGAVLQALQHLQG